MFDTHSHPYLSKKQKTGEIISSFVKNWWSYLVSIWIDIESSEESIILANDNDKVFASIWVWPSDTIKYNWKIKETIDKLEKLYLKNREKIVWIWECGLDYHWVPSLVNEYLNAEDIIKLQKKFFIAQINLAKKYNLPVIIHNRKAKNDTLEILKQENCKNFIFHCFSENLEFAEKCLKYSPNCKISFSWIVTFKNAKDIQETAKNIPLKNIIIETDSPYLSPVPYRWRQENKPEFVKYVLEKIIELRSEDADVIEKQIMENSLEAFSI